MAGMSWAPIRTQSLVTWETVHAYRALQQTGVAGVNVGEHLNQRNAWGRLQMKVMVANRIGENPLSGMTQEASGNVGHGGIVIPPRNRKDGTGNPSPTAERTRDLSKLTRIRQCNWLLS